MEEKELPPITIGDLEAEIARLRVRWNDSDRVDAVLKAAERELARIREERADYYGRFGRGV